MMRFKRLFCKVFGHRPVRLGLSVCMGQKSQDVGCLRCDTVCWGPRGWPISRILT